MKVIDNEIAILTPSYINNQNRFSFAHDSLESLNSIIDSSYRHIVVNDKPKMIKILPERFHSWIPSSKWHNKAKEIYKNSNVTLIDRFGSGSASAVLRSVREAMNQGFKFGFIHLDDHVYIDNFKVLIENAKDSFGYDKNLLMIRFSGYPLIYNGFKEIVCENGRIQFDSVTLQPRREKDYTLWWSYFDRHTIEGNYWPIALWFCLYRLDFLEKLLDYPGVKRMKHLAHVELFYKNTENWHRFIEGYNGKFAYINMQFGGFEMHRNENWRELINLPNHPVR